MMRPPCELVQKEYLPNLRSNLALRLHESGQSQIEIAKRMNITQAAVSKYISQGSKKSSLQKHVDVLAGKLMGMILSDTPQQDMMVREICKTCMYLRIGSSICKMHRESVPALGEVKCQICTDLLAGDENEFSNRGEILRDIQEALLQISNAPDFSNLIPQVRSNLVACGEDAATYMDVAGVPGRITLVDGRAVALASPQFGASQHTAGLLLWARTNWPSIRACLVISGSEQILEGVRFRSWNIITLSKPALDHGVISDTAQKDANDMDKSLMFLALHVPGGVGVEPILYLFGPDAVFLTKAAIPLSHWS
ncbi:MAG: thiamine-phosphate synthase family protein [Candidatus Thorarchaeota archaeon]|jgi:predicted fused transcriptional regulator/phosphomethylpyrimidine kinase/predicted transcriptional regulator